MQAYAETTSKTIAEAENALRASLDRKEPKYDAFEPLLEKLRILSQDFVFLTFPAAAAKSVEDRLWDGHVRVNKKFQKHLKFFREDVGKKKHVERRKAEKLYLQFIKASMQFYRGYIQRLASHFKNVAEVRSIAKKLYLDTTSADPPVVVASAHRDALLASCHNSLMRLGDLSRYRETELETKTRNWGPAKGHYQLALSVKPESGAAYNQLAVMALADDDHLRAVYYLHRAAATSKPFPVARDNIKLEFEKLLKAEPEEKSALSDISKQTVDVLENRFLAIHANCHSRPADFVTYSAKTTQFLQLIAVGFEEIKDRSLDKVLQKMCLISIISEHLAWKGISAGVTNLLDSSRVKSEKELKAESKLVAEHERNCQSVYLLQRFNILTFTTLLKITSRELASEIEASSVASIPESRTVSASVQRLLPHLRQYSSWLLSNIHFLLKPRHSSTGKCMEQFWKVYVKTVNLLLLKFPIPETKDMDHLFEEDEDTLSFAPFSSNVVRWRYKFEDGRYKPGHPKEDTDRAVNDEMLARVRRFVFDAATITNQQDKLEIKSAPIALESGEFVFREKIEQPITTIVKPTTPSQPFRSRAHAHASSLNGISIAASPKPNREAEDSLTEQPQQQNNHEAKSSDLNDSDPVAMETMVNNLVSVDVENRAEVSNPHLRQSQSLPFDSSSVVTGTPGPVSNPVNIMDIVRGMQHRTPEPAKTDIMDIIRNMQKRPDGSQSPLMTPAHGHHSSLSNASLPGIWNTAFTPRPGEAPGSSPRPGTASAAIPSSTVPRSSSAFQHELSQQERDIQMRTSPLQKLPFSSWQEPQRGPTSLQVNPWNSGPSSPWQSPTARSPKVQHRGLPQTALFGAIGEPRRNDSRSPSTGRTA